MIAIQRIAQVVSGDREDVRKARSHNRIRGVKIEDSIPGGWSFIVEDASLPARKNQFRTNIKCVVTPVKSERTAKRRNSRQRFVLFSQFRPHVIHFAVEP